MFAPNEERAPMAYVPQQERRMLARRLDLQGLSSAFGALTTGEAFVKYKLEAIKKEWSDLGSGIVGIGGDTKGLKSVIDKFEGLKVDVANYVGEPKATQINTIITERVKRHREYLKTGSISDSVTRIMPSLNQILGILDTAIPTTVPAPATPPTSALVAAAVAPSKPASSFFSVKNLIIGGAITAVVGFVVTGGLKKLFKKV